MNPRLHAAGSLIVTTLVFIAVFMFLISALMGYVLTSSKHRAAKDAGERALHIAEAGLAYYKWHLAHWPQDTQDGTGAPGPYVHTYADPEGGTVGEFSLAVTGNTACSELQSVDITSQGHVYENPAFRRSVSARYARPSVAEFAYIINSNVWAGDDRIIIGPYHSNGGVRMDGDNNSTVSSAQETWECTGSFGCSGTQTKAGVFGDGTHPEFWEYPRAPIDFVGISVDLLTMKARAQTSGLYFPQTSGQNERRGYHLDFQSDGTVDVYRVTNSQRIWSYTTEDAWQERYERITAETFVGTYTLPSSCSLVFVEDRLWLEGVISGKVTVAAADVIHANYETDILLAGNLTYAGGAGGGDGLTAIAQRDILVPLVVPANMALHGIFVAQTGRFGRNHYQTGTAQDVPESFNSYVTRDTLVMHGSVVSNGRVGTQWLCGGSYCSGFAERTNSYDRSLAIAPPPLTPYTSPDYRFIEWRED